MKNGPPNTRPHYTQIFYNGSARFASPFPSLSRLIPELEKSDEAGAKIDYFATTSGELQLVATGESLTALESDYAAMLEDGLLALHQPGFTDIIEQCCIIQDEANRQAMQSWAN